MVFVLQTVTANKTQQDIAAVLRRFEPPVPIEIDYVSLPDSERNLIVFKAKFEQSVYPFSFDGRPYQRLGSTTSIMPQERYQQLLIARMHDRHRWENMVAVDVNISDLDLEEILRTVRIGISTDRLPESTGSDPGDILDRLGLRIYGELINAAVILFGTNFLPYYPQCQLRMARFRGIDKTEFLDNRQIYGHGFKLLDEAMLFLQRHLPVAGRIQAGLFERIDEPLFPVAALREALVNAICHRDYSLPGGGISLAIYDDRLEI